MTDYAPPPTDEDAAAVVAVINTARAEVGLEPLIGFGFPKLSVSFLREKAEQQLRDALGRWRKQRGSTVDDDGVEPFHTPGRDSHGAFTPTPNERRPVARIPEPGSRPSKEMPAMVDVSAIPTDQVVKELTAAGHSRARAKQWAERGNVYRYPTGGQNPIHVFVVDHQKALDARTEPQRNTIQALQTRIDHTEQRLEAATNAGDQRLATMMRNQLQGHRARMEDHQHNLAMAESMWATAHGITPEMRTPEAESQIAHEAGALLAATLENVPLWKRRATKGFMLEFDESMLLGDAVDGLVEAQAKRGGSVITLNRAKFHDPISGLDEGHAMPTGAQTKGEYAINHEMGHLVDQFNLSNTWASAQHEDVWRAAVGAGLMSRYGKGNVREGYAEAFAMWLHDPGSQVARMYAQEFQWDRPVRRVPGEEAGPFDEAYWEALMADESFSTDGGGEPDPWQATRTPKRFAGAEAVAALREGGYPNSQAIEYARQGEVFSRDGKVWSFHPFPTKHPLMMQVRELGDEVRAAKRNPRTNEFYTRLPPDRKARVQQLERKIRGLEQQIANFASRPKKLSTEDVGRTKAALKELEGAVKKLPKWRRDTGGPFMVQIDPDIGRSINDRTRGEAVVGSNTIAISPRVFTDASAGMDRFGEINFLGNTLSLTDVVHHELGHNVDARPEEGGSSRSPGGVRVWEIAKTLDGMTPYGSSATQEGYAEMYRKWSVGDRDSLAVQLYAKAFGWSSSARKSPSPASVNALARRLGITVPRAGARPAPRRAPGSGWSRN